MKKLLFSLLAIGLLFASCGKEDAPEDLTVKDITPLVGSFSGTCKVDADLANTTTTLNPSSIVVGSSLNAGQLALNIISPFGSPNPPIPITNFNYTSSARDIFSFNIAGYNNATFNPIPSYIISWYSGVGKEFDANSISEVTYNLANTSGQYKITTKTLTVTYKATVSIVGKTNGVANTKPHTLTYTFTLVKQ